MFRKVLVANRGEIALRVIRACKELGVKTVAVYSTADVDSMHVQLADEAICIGPAPSSESYLKIDRIISAAEIADVDAIHPGYGFLSENAQFADICESCKIKFIGPSADVIRMMGDKNTARDTAKRAKIPVTPGSDGIVKDEKEAKLVAAELGYPVMIKATAGGGGKGMRLAFNEAALESSFHNARSEALKAFGNGDVYIEKLILNPHHIEFQIVGDSHGNVVHLGERDCSLQRRNQKIIEETPVLPAADEQEAAQEDGRGLGAPRQGDRLRELPAPSSSSSTTTNNFYFMEMNTRIQVEHPITEEVFGCDLIKEQIRIAAGQADQRPRPEGDPARARHRVPHQRRGSLQRLPPQPGQDQPVLRLRRPRRARRHPHLLGLHRPAVLRLDDRQAHRHRCDAGDLHRPHPARAQRIPRRGYQDDDPFPGCDPEELRLPQRRLQHRLGREFPLETAFDLR